MYLLYTLLYIGETVHNGCKYFSQAQLLRNLFVINALQNLLFYVAKA